jgi:outer membrane protein OmpA-like peptidoglycan-associated protein
MRKHHSEEENPFSLSIGDLMAATLFVFVLLLSASLLKMKDQTDKLNQQNKTIKEITRKYEDDRQEILHSLQTHFGDQLTEWGAEIIPSKLCIRFSKQSMFANNNPQLNSEFLSVLDDFFPKYINLLMQYQDVIAEIRIEGHTSSVGTYFHNMKLSQERSRNVLQYCWGLANMQQREWMKLCVTANGLSYSHPILVDGVEDENKSRRVEFRILTKSEESIDQINNQLQ